MEVSKHAASPEKAKILSRPWGKRREQRLTLLEVGLRQSFFSNDIFHHKFDTENTPLVRKRGQPKSSLRVRGLCNRTATNKSEQTQFRDNEARRGGGGGKVGEGGKVRRQDERDGRRCHIHGQTHSPKPLRTRAAAAAAATATAAATAAATATAAAAAAAAAVWP
jgi:hypothetical protein